MTNREIYEWIGICLAMNHRPDYRNRVVEPVIGGCIPWELFVSTCSNHLITPTIFLTFKKHDIVRHLPQGLMEYLAEVTQLNAARNEKIITQIGEITDALRSYRIYPIFLKGSAHLIDQLYPEIAYRMVGDIDFLVREQDYLRSVQILSDIGYQCRCQLYGDPMNLKHYPRMWKENGAADIEIHRIPVSEKYAKWLNYQAIASEMYSPIGNPDCFVLSDKHKIILNFIHSQLGHSGKTLGIVSYRDIYDLHLIMQRHDKPMLEKDSGFMGIASSYFQLANHLLHHNDQKECSLPLKRNLFFKIHQLNLSSRTFYLTYHGSRKFLSRIKAYFRILPGIITSADVRKLVFDRLSHPPWIRKFPQWGIRF